MRDAGPITLLRPFIEIEGGIVARSLGMEIAVFRQLMEDSKITVLCERGTGEDTGRYRASFYYGNRRVRLLVDQHGRLLSGT